MRTLAISDIHGCWAEFNLLLEKVQYDPSEDQLILVGDYVDRGRDSKRVIEQLIDLRNRHGVVVLRGNHDQMMHDAILKDSDELNVRWSRNGARQTLESYCGADFFGEEMEPGKFREAKEIVKSSFRHHLDFLGSLDLYHETDSHIFVHAGVNPLHSDWKQQPHEDFIWIREPFYANPTGLDKKVVFGHTPAIHLHESADIWFSPLEDKIGIDGGCVFGKQLNCLEINERNEYKMHVVPKDDSLRQETEI
ncbi:metallophosphoesterase family protein [Paenibacillus chibensis]|uniref:Metallophosphoesterase family protein n=1 Tax=Paenibacillus chibensis TaxID=59846 RepID=A0ABU6PWV7_9BACL|nr:metallophosphoesterase family protein [Paenibacillus chibensis]